MQTTLLLNLVHSNTLYRVSSLINKMLPFTIEILTIIKLDYNPIIIIQAQTVCHEILENFDDCLWTYWHENRSKRIAFKTYNT